MGIYVSALLSHQLQPQDCINLQQQLNNYSIASRVIPLPCPPYFYGESIGDGRLFLPRDWLESKLNHEQDSNEKTFYYWKDLSITDALGLDIHVYKHLMVLERRAGEKWAEFILDPIRRLALRKDVQAVANFLGTDRVIYLADAPYYREKSTLSQVICQLQNQQYQLFAIQTVAKQIQSYRQFFGSTAELNMYQFGCIDTFETPITSTQLQSLANLQLAIIVLALDQITFNYVTDSLVNRKDLIHKLEKKVLSYPQWLADVKKYAYWELTEEQLTLINLLSEELKIYLEEQPFSLLNDWEEPSFQKLAKEIVYAFEWDLCGIDDWIDEQLELTQK